MGDRRIRLWLSGQGFKVVLQLQNAGMNLLHLSQFAIQCQIGGSYEVRNTSTLRSRLEDALVFLDGVVQFLAFLNIHRTGLFAVDVLAGTRSENGCRGMPAVPGGDDDRVNVPSFEDAGHVIIGSAIRVPILGVCLGLDDFAPLSLRIGNGNELTILLLEETIQDLATSWSQSNATHHNPVAWSDASILAKGAGWNDGGHADGGNGSGFQKGSAGCFCVHGVYLTGVNGFAGMVESSKTEKTNVLFRACKHLSVPCRKEPELSAFALPMVGKSMSARIAMRTRSSISVTVSSWGSDAYPGFMIVIWIIRGSAHIIAVIDNQHKPIDVFATQPCYRLETSDRLDFALVRVTCIKLLALIFNRLSQPFLNNGRHALLKVSLGLCMRFQTKWKCWLVALCLSRLVHAEASVMGELGRHAALSDRQKGVVLINEFGCVSCHASTQDHFKPRQGPELSGLGNRVKTGWLKEFFKAPHHVSIGLAHMDFPTEIHDSGQWSRPQIENALSHYLLFQAAPAPDQLKRLEGSVEKGDGLFHSIGCIVCHGNSSSDVGASWMESMRKKFRTRGLWDFLLDPLKTHPDGRMPDMHLTYDEASDLVAFIMNGVDSTRTSEFVSQPGERKKGERLFGQLNCNACHEPETQVMPVSIPRLETLRLDHGCLSTETGPWPRFTLNEEQRSWMHQALQSENQWTPSERIHMQLAQFNCVACHERDGIGGVSPEEDPYFASHDPNLGEQGRLPPRLDGVGAKLHPDWMRKILVQGAVSRPYMKTRMPRFGAEILDELMELLETVDSSLPLSDFEMPRLNDTRRAGRDLAGTKGMACVTCHAFKGIQSGAMGAIDMSIMGQRVTREWFHHYLSQPQRFSPGTLMPDFWPEGHSSKPEILDGNARKQIEALWVYLSDGYSLGAPAGLHREPMRLVAGDQEAVMLRRAYPGVGKRGIGVGLPHGHNYVFNADKLGLAMLWKGEFADPSGVWLSQGHGRVRPLARGQISFPVQPQWQRLDSESAPWPEVEQRQVGQRFEGYRLDAQRVPTFLYAIDETLIEDALKEIESEGQWTLERTLRFKTNDDMDNLILRAAVAAEIQALGASVFQISDAFRIAVNGDAEGYVVNASEGDELRIRMSSSSPANSIKIKYQF
jgi:cytochrome c551/c552